uniref:F-box domain-containing protein n=1 Tax=Mycena chlorophos TaxID=658473 RepID=A0ABQ0LTT5_MYCCL|nr:predicted protein [Mycena chlorophos]
MREGRVSHARPVRSRHAVSQEDELADVQPPFGFVVVGVEREGRDEDGEQVSRWHGEGERQGPSSSASCTMLALWAAFFGFFRRPIERPSLLRGLAADAAACLRAMTTATLVSLPPELLTAFVEEVAADQSNSSLRSLALVHSVLRPHCLRHLFRSVHLHREDWREGSGYAKPDRENRPRNQRTFSTFPLSPHITAHIRGLSIHVPDEGKDERALARILEAVLAHQTLQALSITGFTLVWDLHSSKLTAVLPAVMTMPSLRILHLINLRDLPLRPVYDAMRRVRCISFNHCAFGLLDEDEEEIDWDEEVRPEEADGDEPGEDPDEKNSPNLSSVAHLILNFAYEDRERLTASHPGCTLRIQCSNPENRARSTSMPHGSTAFRYRTMGCWLPSRGNVSASRAEGRGEIHRLPALDLSDLMPRFRTTIDKTKFRIHTRKSGASAC